MGIAGQEHGENTGRQVERKFRLTRTTDFMRVRRSGKSFAHPLVVLIAYPSSQRSVRIGVAASRAVGNAIQRNRAKRQLRACLNQALPSMKKGWDIVLLARRPILEASFDDICAAVHKQLVRAGVLEEINGS